ncbi:MAG: type pilus assembly protein PilB [Candidatus Hydrogenedentes bacterium]|nr:type pilus assembly protein PilB [Candidatus Hydrogenedentota bacterium]
MKEYVAVCSSCGQKVRVKKGLFGKDGVCPKCKAKIPIAEESVRALEPPPVRKERPKRAVPVEAPKKRIGELFIEAEIISQDQLQEALDIQKEKGGKIGEILVSLGYVDIETFANLVARQPGVASLDLSNYDLSSDLIALIPREIAIAHELIPIDRLGSLLTVGMACPLDAKTIRELEEITKLRVKALLCSQQDIKAAIARYYPATDGAPKPVPTFDYGLSAPGRTAPLPEQPPEAPPAPEPEPELPAAPQLPPEAAVEEPEPVVEPEPIAAAPVEEAAPAEPEIVPETPTEPEPIIEEPVEEPFQAAARDEDEDEDEDEEGEDTFYTPPADVLGYGAPVQFDLNDTAQGLTGALRLENVLVLVRELQVASLPALPDAVTRMREAMARPDVPMNEIANIVGSDPSIAAKILRLVNSDDFNLPAPVSNLGLAVNLLGMHETYRQVMGSTVVNSFIQWALFDYRKLWRESTACARTAVEIAEECDCEHKDSVYAAALLHDIGRIALLETSPQRYSRIDPILTGADLIAAEEDALGMAHPEAGYELATNWYLPEAIAEPIRFHHNFQFADRYKDVTAIVFIASALAEKSIELTDEGSLAIFMEALEFLGLDLTSLAAITMGDLF